MYKKTTNIQ